MKKQYRTVSPEQIPQGIVWHTPPQNQGQIIETSFAYEGPVSYCACQGDKFKRVKDTSNGNVLFYSL